MTKTSTKTPDTCKGLPCVGYCTGCPSAHSCTKILDYIDELRVKIHDIEVSPCSPSPEMRNGLRKYKEALTEMKMLRRGAQS